MKILAASVAFAILSFSPTAKPTFAQSSALVTTGVRGMSVIEYHKLRTDAIQAQAARDHARAAELFTRVTQAWPLDGENWARLARSHINSGNYRAALEPLKRGVALGTGWQGDLYTGFTQNAKIWIARAHALLGEPDSSIVWLRSAIVDERFERPTSLRSDSTFASLWQHREFQALTGRRDSLLARDEGWRLDIAFVTERIRHYNALYRYGALPDSITRYAADLSRNVAARSDAQIILGIERMLAMLGHGHNMVYFWEPGRAHFDAIPVVFTQFSDGLFITDAAPDLAHFIGHRVVAFDGSSVDRVVSATDLYLSNDHSANPNGGGMFYRWPAALHALGLTKAPDAVELTLVDRGGKSAHLALATRTWGPASRKIAAPAQASTPAPLWLSRGDEMFWTSRIDEKTLYTQVNNILNARTETLAQFGMRLRAELDTTRTANLIIDLRRNNGGNSYLYRELLRTLIAFDAKPNTQLYVITERMTYSAAMNFVTEVDRLTDALFVGVPAAGVPIQLGGDAAEIELPYSGIKVGVTTVVFQYTTPRDTRPYVAPDIPVALKSTDYFTNRDVALETILAIIAGA